MDIFELIPIKLNKLLHLCDNLCAMVEIFAGRY